MTNLQIIEANISNIDDIIALLQDDVLGKNREINNGGVYVTGLQAIIADNNNDFFIALHNAEIVGCFQLTIIPSLSRGASRRAQIESVRVKTNLRGTNIGKTMMQWAIRYSKTKGCKLVQLTTDKTRKRAHNFYVNLGFEPSHIGMKLHI